jgi:nucleoid-associated protein YgaU
MESRRCEGRRVLVRRASELASVRASRILVACGVVLLGLCAALPFRQPRPVFQAAAERPFLPLSLTLRRPEVPLELAPKNDISPAVGLEAIAASSAARPSDSRVPATDRSPDLRNLAPPPALPVSFQPLGERPPASDWHPEPPLAARPMAKARRYRLRDGDTLEKLAERFLANRERAAEIFEANRDVLARPDLLPVGVTIVLPPRETAEELEPVKRN